VYNPNSKATDTFRMMQFE